MWRSRRFSPPGTGACRSQAYGDGQGQRITVEQQYAMVWTLHSGLALTNGHVSNTSEALEPPGWRSSDVAGEREIVRRCNARSTARP